MIEHEKRILLAVQITMEFVVFLGIRNRDVMIQVVRIPDVKNNILYLQ
jgi:hypothetical protein